ALLDHGVVEVAAVVVRLDLALGDAALAVLGADHELDHDAAGQVGLVGEASLVAVLDVADDGADAFADDVLVERAAGGGGGAGGRAGAFLATSSCRTR